MHPAADIIPLATKAAYPIHGMTEMGVHIRVAIKTFLFHWRKPVQSTFIARLTGSNTDIITSESFKAYRRLNIAVKVMKIVERLPHVLLFLKILFRDENRGIRFHKTE